MPVLPDNSSSFDRRIFSAAHGLRIGSFQLPSAGVGRPVSLPRSG
jgi:hypothetical protein